MPIVLRGYAIANDGNLVLIGTMLVPHSKDKPSPREREEKTWSDEVLRSLRRWLLADLMARNWRQSFRQH